MKIILFELACYGITNIMVVGSIFEKWRGFWTWLNPSFFGKLFSCFICLSTWIGGLLSIIMTHYGFSTPFYEYGVTNDYLRIFLDACLTSGIVWVTYSLQYSFESKSYLASIRSDNEEKKPL